MLAQLARRGGEALLAERDRSFRLEQPGVGGDQLVARLVGVRVELDRALVLCNCAPELVTAVALEQVAAAEQELRVRRIRERLLELGLRREEVLLAAAGLVALE